MDKISQEYDYYTKNKQILKEKYDNKYIAIKDCKVVMSGDSKKQVLDNMLKKNHNLGDFIVHLVSDTSDVVHRLYSRVYWDMDNVPHRAFTRRYKKLVRVLETQVFIENPFNAKSRQCRAIWDTGAEITTIVQSVADDLGCIATDKANMVGVGSQSKEVNVYDINLIDPAGFKITNMAVASTSSIGGGGEILIGMDIIGLGDLAITNVNEETTFTFSVPSYKEADYVARADKLNPTIIKRLEKKGLFHNEKI